MRLRQCARAFLFQMKSSETGKKARFFVLERHERRNRHPLSAVALFGERPVARMADACSA
jgi:hypothetical protein